MVSEWSVEPDITPDELLRQLTRMARGTSQACSYRSQELYFQKSQKVKEAMRDYEDGQGLLYQEAPVHLDRDLVGPLLATFVHLQRELRMAREEWQTAWDRQVDANVHRREAENEVAQLKRDLFGSQEATREAQEAARKHERDYHETLVFLRRAQNVNPAAADPADRARIQSLETQLNDANQQLRQLREERAPNAVDGQIAVRQDQANERLEALQADNKEAHRALAQVAAERDRARKNYVDLQMQTLQDKARRDAESNALEVQCLQAEAEVLELKEKVDTLEGRGAYRVSPPSASATLGPTSHPVFGGLGRRSAQTTPLMGRGMSGLGVPQDLTPPSAGRGLTAHSAYPGLMAANSTPTPSPGTGSGLSALAPGPYLGAPNANAGHAQRRGEAMDTEGAPQSPEASAVRAGAPSTTTNQGPTQAGSRPAPQ